MERATYAVDGMTCGGCAASVTRAIHRKAPEVEVDVDLDAKAVRIGGAHDAAVVKAAIRAAGFDVVEP